MRKIQKYSPLILRFGLAAVFLANAYVAWFAPDEFKEILEHSFLSGILPGTAVLLNLIGLSDALVAVLLILGKWPRIVTAYAAAWIAGVVIVSQPSGISDALEHVGFFAIALYLWVNTDLLYKKS